MSTLTCSQIIMHVFNRCCFHGENGIFKGSKFPSMTLPLITKEMLLTSALSVRTCTPTSFLRDGNEFIWSHPHSLATLKNDPPWQDSWLRFSGYSLYGYETEKSQVGWWCVVPLQGLDLNKTRHRLTWIYTHSFPDWIILFNIKAI